MLGRLAFAEGEAPSENVVLNYYYGFSADVGGGPYDRRQTLAESGPDTWEITVSRKGPATTLQQALNQWAEAGKPDGIIQIADNGVYYGDQVRIELEDGGRLVIEAADGVCPGVRLIGNLEILAPSSGGAAAFTLNGLLIEGSLSLETRDKGDLALTITHCTLSPGRTWGGDGASDDPGRYVLMAEAGAGNLEVTIAHSIVGPVRLPSDCRHLTIRDSIVDAPVVKEGFCPAIAADKDGYGPATTLERTTIFGPVRVKELSLASEVIFAVPVEVERRQVGHVRYSFVPDGSQTPRRFRCQPDLALARQAKELNQSSISDLPPDEKNPILARLRPRFTSVQYGHPAYAQLGPGCAEEILTGAEDGSEMGAFSHLKQPQREANLRAVLNEYLRARLEAGLFYVT